MEGRRKLDENEGGLGVYANHLQNHSPFVLIPHLSFPQLQTCREIMHNHIMIAMLPLISLVKHEQIINI